MQSDKLRSKLKSGVVTQHDYASSWKVQASLSQNLSKIAFFISRFQQQLPQSPPSLLSALPFSIPKAMFGLGIDKCLPQWGCSLPLSGLNHISRVCTDVSQSKLFYSQVLGFVEIRRPQSLQCQGAW